MTFILSGAPSRSIKATSCCTRPCLWHLAAHLEPLLSPLVSRSCITRCSRGIPFVTLALAQADSLSAIGNTDCIVAGLSTNAHKIKYKLGCIQMPCLLLSSGYCRCPTPCRTIAIVPYPANPHRLFVRKAHCHLSLPCPVLPPQRRTICSSPGLLSPFKSSR